VETDDDADISKTFGLVRIGLKVVIAPAPIASPVREGSEDLKHQSLWTLFQRLRRLEAGNVIKKVYVLLNLHMSW